MKLDQVDPVGLQALQAALDALEQGIRPPILGIRSFGVPALCEEVKLIAPRPHRLADQFFTLQVALGCVDDVESGVECVAEQPGHRVDRGFLESDLGSAETQRAHIHVGLAESSLFHRSSPQKKETESTETRLRQVYAEMIQ